MSTDTTRICLGAAPLTASIAVSDMGAAQEFYEDRLGLRAAQEQTDGSRLYASASGASLHVYASPEHAGKATATLATCTSTTSSAWWTSSPAAASVRALRRPRAASRRARDLRGRGRRPGRLAQDPDGNTFALEERPAGEAFQGRFDGSRSRSAPWRRRSRPVHGALGGGPDVTLFGAWGPIERGAEALRRTFEWVREPLRRRRARARERRRPRERRPRVHRRLRARHGQRGRRRPPAHDDPGDPRLPPRGREWRLVHRHADFPPRDQRTATGASGKATPSLSTRAARPSPPRATCPARGS